MVWRQNIEVTHAIGFVANNTIRCLWFAMAILLKHVVPYVLTESLLRDHLATRDHEPGILDVANIMQGIAVHRQQIRCFARRENA